MRVQLRQNLWHSLLHKVVDIYSVYILVIYNVQQVVEFVAARVDDAQPVAREVVGIERAYENAHHYADGHYKRHETVISLILHILS